jgi:hypothetical protein
MRKCVICTVGSWVVGLSTVGWGVAAVFHVAIPAEHWVRYVGIAAGVVGVGFLAYQPPLPACPRCPAANHRS